MGFEPATLTLVVEIVQGVLSSPLSCSPIHGMSNGFRLDSTLL
jgi:hypothetical protein